MSRRTDLTARSIFTSPGTAPRYAFVRGLAVMLGLAASVVAHAAAPYAGRSLDDVLHDLATTGGVHLIYTAELVPRELRVAREPDPGPVIEVLAQVLAEAGLELKRIEGRTYAVVRIPDAQPVQKDPSATATEPLDELVVTASRYTLVTDVPDMHVFLTKGEFEALPRLAEDPLKAVHRLPGAASNGLSGLAHMRGGETNETLVLFDGLPLYEPFHMRLLQSPTSVLDERIVGGLDALAGGFTAEYGDRMSGIIDARSLRPDADAYYELGVSLIHANALVSHRFASGNGQWLASFRRSNLDEVADVLRSDLGEPKYMDGFARIDYAWSPATRASLHMLLARDSLEVNNSADTEHSVAEYSNAYFWGTLEHDWSPQLTTSALLSYTDVTAERVASLEEPGLSLGQADDERDYDVFGLRLDARHVSDRWLHRAGIDVRSLAARYDYQGEVVDAPDNPFPGATSFERTLSPSPSGAHIAAYYTVRARLTATLTGELGLRWDRQTYAVEASDQFGPRLNLAWQVTDRTHLLASWGRYQQFQGIEELQVEDGIEDFQPAQRVDHAILGLEHEIGAALTLRAEAYVKDYAALRTRYENLYDPLSLAPELRWDRVAIAPSSARAEGIELLLARRNDSPWTGWLSYAWSRVTDSVDGDEIRRSWDQDHTLNAGLGWTQGPWRATIATQYHRGWPVTPVALDPAGDVVLGPRNSERYADYGSLDARVSYEWGMPHGTLTAHLEVTNALNRRNPCCTDLTYVVDAAGTPTLERELRHWLPLIPSVGVLWKF